MAEREYSRIQRLNMTSTDEHRSRNHSGTPLQGVPVPQQVFMGADQSVPLRHSVPAASTVAGQYQQAGYAGPASMLPPPVPGDVLDVELGGPTRYTAPMQNAQAGSSCLRPSQMGPTPMLPQPVPVGVGLGGPTGYTAPHVPVQNAHVGPSHLASS